MRYVQIDTQSDPQSSSYPTTEKQKDLGRLLVQELQKMGIEMRISMNMVMYTQRFLSNTDRKVPVICFCAHMDTAPDCSGTNVKPILHSNYQGKDIILPDDPTQVLRAEEYPYLKKLIGHDIITASGTTLLGSDDKAGVAEIMDLANFLMTNKQM